MFFLDYLIESERITFKIENILNHDILRQARIVFLVSARRETVYVWSEITFVEGYEN